MTHPQTNLLSQFCESQVWVGGCFIWFLCSGSHRLRSRCQPASSSSEAPGKNWLPGSSRLLAQLSSMLLSDRGLHFLAVNQRSFSASRGFLAPPWLLAPFTSKASSGQLNPSHTLNLSDLPLASSLLSPARESSLLLKGLVIRSAQLSNPVCCP